MKLASSLLIALLFCNGCATALTNQLLQRQNPVRVDADGRQVKVGVDLFALDEVAQHPFLHGIAAVLDAGMGYLAYEALEGEDGGGGTTHNETSYTIMTQGDQSPVTIGDSSPVDNSQNTPPESEPETPTEPTEGEDMAQRARRGR